MKKRILICAAAALAILAVAGGLFGYTYLRKNYVKVEDGLYRKDLQELDLRDQELSPAQFEAFRAALPDCSIRWTVPFQGNRLDNLTEALRVSSLPEEDLALLALFPRLKTVDATACTDLEQVRALLDRYPQLEVDYMVRIEDMDHRESLKTLKVAGTDLAELHSQLADLPMLETVTLLDPVTDSGNLMALLEDYPHIHFNWKVEILGRYVTGDAEEADFSGIPVDSVEEIEAAVTCLPNLRKVIMCDCGISNEEMDALNRRDEDCLYVWSVSIGRHITLRTDVETFMPVGQFNVYPDDKDLYNLRYCTELVLLDLGHRHLYNVDFVAFMPKLKYLLLCHNRISDLTPLQNLKNVEFLELFLCHNITDLTPLLGMTGLKDLNLSHSYGDPEPIKEMDWLENLWWYQAIPSRSMSDEEMQSIRDALPNTRVVTDSYSSTGGGWRELQNYYDMRDMLGMKYHVG